MPPSRPPASASVRDITAQLAQARIRPSVAQASIPDMGVNDTPPQTAMDRLNAFQASQQEKRIADMALKQTEAEIEVAQSEAEVARTELEIKKLENQARLKELRESVGGSGKGIDATTAFLFEMLDRTMNKQDENKGQNSGDALALVVKEELASIRHEMMSNRNIENDDPVDQLANQMQKISVIKSLFQELTPQQVSPGISDAKADLEHTIRVQEMELSHAARMYELKLKEKQWEEDQSFKRQQLEHEERRAQMLSQSFNQIVSQLGPMISEGLQALVNRPASIPAAMPSYSQPVTAGQPITASIRPDVYQNGNQEYNPEAKPFGQISTAQCEECGFNVQYNHGDREVGCPQCGSTFELQYDPTEFL